MSQSFTDAKGQLWQIEFAVGELKRCKKSDLGNPLDLFDKDNSIIDKLADPEYLVDLLWVVLLPKIEAKGLSPEDFASLFVGDSLYQARRALAVALANFFPDRQRRNAATAMVNKMCELEKLILDKLDPLTAAVNSLDTNELANAAYDSLMSGAASSESIPTASP